MKLRQSKLPSNERTWERRRLAGRWFGFRRCKQPAGRRRSQAASVLILVLWISIGLVAIALYFANSMTFELRASDNRATGIAAEQAIEGAARYVGYVLSNFATNGAVPNNTQFSCAAVPVGDAHFWLIGRDPSGTLSTEPYFGLVDEASKLNLNRAGTNTLSYLPNMTLDFADAIVDWRSTNGSGNYALDYVSLGYTDKNSPFETVDELRLVYGATIDLLVGEDVNRNGVLDANETDVNGNGTLDPGLFEYVTVYSRQPNFHSDGTMLTNVNTRATLRSLLQSTFGSSRATQIMTRLGFTSSGGGGGGGGATDPTFNNLLRFYLNSGMTSAEFAQIAYGITDTTNLYTNGLLNINTASAPVMEALFMGLNVDQNTAQSAAQTLVTYRQQNPNNLNAISWIVDALGNTSPVVQALAGAGRDFITTESFQFTADIAAVGPFGRGYRRVKFIFDISEGTPKIIYRQDLSRLGWALGEKARATWVAKATP
jgi:DNA uptake protein ComE-like DNA-binding protein